MKNKDISEEWTGMNVEGSSLSLISELIHSCNLYAQLVRTWTLQKKNNTEWRESFILRHSHFSVNNDMQEHGNTLTYNLVKCDRFKKLTIA